MVLRGACYLQKHYFLGLKILDMLVAEFNQPIPGRTLTQHRKMSVSFRDQSLYSIFELALTALRQLRTSQAADADLREEVAISTPHIVAAFRVTLTLLVTAGIFRNSICADASLLTVCNGSILFTTDPYLCMPPFFFLR